MKKLMTFLAAGSLFMGAQALVAQTSTNSTDSATEAPAHKKMSQEQRHKQMGELLKALGLTRADFKGLSPEDRMAKIKSTAETVTKDLKAKKEAGTITPEEQTKLDHIEKFLARAKHRKAQEPANQ